MENGAAVKTDVLGSLGCADSVSCGQTLRSALAGTCRSCVSRFSFFCVLLVLFCLFYTDFQSDGASLHSY